MSLTGEANKAGLDYRLIDPTAEDFAGSKINLAVGNMLNVYHQWESDKGTQLVFCDMSIPLSARTSYLSQDRRLYVRDDGAIEMKRGTMHTLEGHESLPYFVVQRGDKDTKRFDVYDAASGVRVLTDSLTKQEAIDSAIALLIDDNRRQDWIIKRETAGEIEQEQIDGYNNDNDVETEGFEYFSREDIAGVSGSAKFSVYDDIKAKLIAGGIPRREIAFIHDVSTPTAKEKLFKAVNAGDVRFLLGSTPKLGAGTNVQKRLVGLHHIDAPWRPSDLEQREGRIIRRGNELYARDPENFTVFIGRYATAQTYDTRRWQILEHKARGIEQLRNFDGTVNEIEDIDGEASNAADMKAAASGDPLILEETKLRNSVRRLEQLQASHADEVLLMSRKARDKQEFADKYGPRYLAGLIRLIGTTSNHPLDKDGFSPIGVEGRVSVNKETAQEAIAGVFGKLRANALLDATIKYRGIEFTLDRHTGWTSVNSETGNLSNYSDTDLFSSSGFIQRMANYVSRLPGLVDETKARIVQSASDAEAMREQAKQDFQQAAELEAVRESHKAVQRALLAKGPVVPEDQKSAVANGIAEQKARLVKLGFSAELKEFFSGSNNYQLGDAEARLPQIDLPDTRMEARINNHGQPFVKTSPQEKNSMNKKPFHEVVAERLIEQLQQGTAPWQRPWQPGDPGSFTPMNPTTGKRYRGINAIQLMSEGRTDQRWLTYKQAAAVGGQVLKGEKGTPIQYWKFTEEQPITDGNGKPVLNDQGEKLTLSVKLERPRVFFATVFNAEQIAGLPPLQPRKEQEWSAVDRAEHILQASGAVIRHGEQNRAFYRPATDSIHLPDKNQFQSADKYYATALHELGHWSGHKSRLDRDLIHPFGSEGYSKEELRAEIASMLLGDELGIGHDPAQHVAYVASWIAVLKNDPLEIFRAAADAEKIQDYVLGLELKAIQEQSAQQDQEQDQPVLGAYRAELERVFGLSANQETDMQVSPPITAQEELTAYQAELARLLKLSTLTPGIYIPGEAAKNANHAAVFVGDDPVILCGPSDDPASAAHAEALAASPHVREAYRASGRTDIISSGVVTGNHIKWQASESAVVSKPSGQVEVRGDNGPLVAIVLNDPAQALTTSLCVTTETARIFDPDTPGLDNGRVLPALSGIHKDEMALISRRAATAGKGTKVEPAGQNGLAAYELTRDEFMKVAVATPLVNHGRKWEVFAGEQSYGFSDGETAGDAVIEAHKRAVNNALYSLSAENTGAVDAKTMPPLRVLNEYPDLVEKFTGSFDFSLTEKTFINVPFKQKDESKTLGAKWDRQSSSWYVPAGVALTPFNKWIPEATPPAVDRPDKTTGQSPDNNPVPMQEREYLAVPYGERAAAKAAGALWDKAAKSWYVGPDGDMDKLERWQPDNVPHQQGPAMRPEDEFAEALRSLGCVVDGNHPIMDGAKHRIVVDGDKSGERTGFYVGHLDGHPAGYIKNNRTGIDMKWKSKGYVLDPEEKAQMQAEATIKLRDREVALQAKQKAVAIDILALLSVSAPAPADHPYLQAKQVRPGDLRIVPPAATVLPDGSTIIIGADWKESSALRESNPDKLVFTAGDLLVPAYDANGTVWTAQTIQSSGRKIFAKDSVKQENFHVVGAAGNGLDALIDAPVLVISEGYASADSLSNVLRFPTVSAFDSGNLVLVAKALHEKFPDKPVVIAGDDDKYVEATQGHNPGRSKANEAAKAVGGKVLLPIFSPGEQASDPKGFSDFNDLATKSVLGKEGIKRQVGAIVDAVLEKHLARSQQQEPVQQQVRVAKRGL